MYNTKNKIIRFIIAPTGTYNAMFTRPYESNITKQTHNFLVELACKKELNTGSLNSISNELIRPSATPESEISIANGFGNNRLRFYIEIETEGSMGQITTEQLIGYTDHYGMVDYRGNVSLDQNMVFKINAINETKKSIIKTPYGNVERQVVLESSQVINNENYKGINNTNNWVYGLRPEDIYDNITDTDLINGHLEDSMVISTRGTIGTSAIKSKRKNNIAGGYVSDILNGFIDIRNSEGNFHTDKILEQAKTIVQSPYVHQDKFMSFLKKRHQFSTGSEFKISDLTAFDNNALNLMESIPPDISQLHYSGLTESWAGSDYCTQFATIIAQAIPTYMFENSIRTINFVVSNDNMSCIPIMLNEGVDLINAHNARVAETNYNNFEFKVKNELFNGLSLNNQLSFSCRIKANILEDIWIHISLQGSPITVYCCPSFCDSLLSPVYTSDKNKLDSIGSDMNCIMGDIPDSNYPFDNYNYENGNNEDYKPFTSSLY